MTPYFTLDKASEQTGLNIELRVYGCPETRENYHVFIDGNHHFAGTECECKIFLTGYACGMNNNKK